MSLSAGVAAPLASEFEKWEETITTNLISVMYLSKITLPYLEESVKAHGHASLIVTSSVVGFMKFGPFAPCMSTLTCPCWSNLRFIALNYHLHT